MQWNKYPDSIPIGDTRKVLMVIESGRGKKVVLGWWIAPTKCFSYNSIENANHDMVGWLDIPEIEELNK